MVRISIVMRKIWTNGRRIVTRFLFIPKILNHELRWLEFAEIEQKIKYTPRGKEFWLSVNWVNK